PGRSGGSGAAVLAPRRQPYAIAQRPRRRCVVPGVRPADARDRTWRSALRLGQPLLERLELAAQRVGEVGEPRVVLVDLRELRPPPLAVDLEQLGEVLG